MSTLIVSDITNLTSIIYFCIIFNSSTMFCCPWTCSPISLSMRSINSPCMRSRSDCLGTAAFFDADGGDPAGARVCFLFVEPANNQFIYILKIQLLKIHCVQCVAEWLRCTSRARDPGFMLWYYEWAVYEYIMFSYKQKYYKTYTYLAHF